MPAKQHPLLPDFLIIGAGKSGTTSLDKYLSQHPQIFIPYNKEPNFFGYEGRQESDFQNPEDRQHFRNSVTSLDRYTKMFEPATEGQLKGETSNTYLYHAQAPERIKQYIPDVKLIAVLRQPAERLYSRYLHLARENRLPTRSLSDVKDRNTIWWKRNDLIPEGFYADNIQKYFDLFPRDQFRIFLYEDMKNQQAVVQDIYNFLGVDASFSPDTSLRYNESGMIKNQTLNKIYGQGGLLSRTLRAVMPNTVMQKIKTNLFLKGTITRLRKKNLDKPMMDPEIRRFLTEDVYAEDIRKLQTLLNRDLSHWLKV